MCGRTSSASANDSRNGSSFKRHLQHHRVSVQQYTACLYLTISCPVLSRCLPPRRSHTKHRHSVYVCACVCARASVQVLISHEPSDKTCERAGRKQRRIAKMNPDEKSDRKDVSKRDKAGGMGREGERGRAKTGVHTHTHTHIRTTLMPSTCPPYLRTSS